MKDGDLKEERVTLLNAWLSFEKTHGAEEDIEKVQKQMPRKTKRRRKLDDDSYEEYIDYVFPADDVQAQKLSNFLAMAQSWKQSGGTITGNDE
jgi:crooked neck